MIKSTSILITFVAISFSLFAQDTIKMMQYNLLNYGNYTDYCTSSNNNIETKAENLAITIDYVKPDIFTVNEMDASLYSVTHLLGNALNINGVSHYRKAAILNTDNGYTINMLYYNNEKIELIAQQSVSTGLRDINIYTLKHLNSSEQVVFHVVVAHLKAGNDDQAMRAQMTQDLMDYLENYTDKTNFIMAGDFNVYTSEEDAFQNLINPSVGNVLFTDPIDDLGAWNNSYSFKDIHTQSTHTDQNGCASYGGMDDRFDFILASDDIMEGSNLVKYIDDSYTTIGQDGNHFNSSLISSTNYSAPSEVIDALYNTSDHLPLTIELAIGSPSGISELQNAKHFGVSNINTTDGNINFQITTQKPEDLTICIYDILGKTLFQNKYSKISDEEVQIPCYKSGMLLMRINNTQGDCETYRILKQN